MNELLTQLLELLRRSKLISHRVYSQVEPKYHQSYQDIRQQLDFIWCQNMLYDYGKDRLSHYARYLAALEKRLERMDINFPREADNLAVMTQWQQHYHQLAEQPHNRAYCEAKQEFAWMLQEFRVSLFAQGIKTAFPISEKRLQKQLDILGRF